jgi:hypothetical protein
MASFLLSSWLIEHFKTHHLIRLPREPGLASHWRCNTDLTTEPRNTALRGHSYQSTVTPFLATIVKPRQCLGVSHQVRYNQADERLSYFYCFVSRHLFWGG